MLLHKMHITILAESYLKTDQKQQALHAFKNASEMDYEAKDKRRRYL